MIITIIAVLFLFVTSLVPISNSLSKDLSSKIPQDITDMAQLTTPFHLSNSYGLFRRQVLFSSVLLADLGYFLSGKTIYRPFFFSRKQNDHKAVRAGGPVEQRWQQVDEL